MTTAQTVFRARVPLATWSIEAEPARLEQAAARWRSIGRTMDREAERLNTEAAKLFDQDWTGRSREEYERHVKTLRDAIAGTKGTADEAAATLTGLAGTLRDAQGRLTDSLGALMSQVEFTVAGGTVEFTTGDAAEEELVRQGVRDAEGAKSRLDFSLRTAAGEIRALEARFQEVCDEWYPYNQETFPFFVPAEALRSSQVLYLPDGSVVVNTGGPGGVDRVLVDTDDEGRTFIEINGVRTPIVGSDLTVRTGDGADTVEIKTDAPVTVLTGTGDDTVTSDSDSAGHVFLTGDGEDEVETGDGPSYVATGGGGDEVETGDGIDIVATGSGDDEVYGGGGGDTVFAGRDKDYVDGQSGDDRLYGGDGDDIVYGLDGADQIVGGRGSDYLEGGKDDDVMFGGEGNDLVSGGRGDDHLYGGASSDQPLDGRYHGDVVYGGEGRDTAEGGSGEDRVYAQAEDTVRGPAGERVNVDIVQRDNIEVKGSDDFKARIEADLDLYKASPAGRQMIENLYNAGDLDLDDGRRIEIREFDEENGTALDGWDPEIEINPEFRGPENGVPSTILYHELAHAYDYLNLTGQEGKHVNPADPDYGGGEPVPQDERQAVGLPIDVKNGKGEDFRIDPKHPLQFTENGLREEFGLEKRDHYGSATR